MPAPPPPTSAPKAPPAKAVAQSAGLALREKKTIVPRIVVNAVQGWGKTSMGAHAPGAAIIMTKNELGYDTLLAAGLVPQIPAMVAETWRQALDTVDALIANPGEVKTLVVDGMGGAERLCHEHVCATEFRNEWGERGFAAYQKGYDSGAREWWNLLTRLETLAMKHGVASMLLGHTRVEKFQNPMGADFDRYVCDVHRKTWAATSRWANGVLFGTFFTVVDASRQEEKKSIADRKGKGIGGTERVIYTEQRDAFDAKNQLGLPEEIWLSNDRTAAWREVMSQVGAKAVTTVQESA